MNDTTNHRACGLFKEAWKKVDGMKRPFWGGVALIFLIFIAGSAFIALFFYVISHIIFTENFSQFMHPFQNITPAISIKSIVLGFFYYLTHGLFNMFFLIPMQMGIYLIALRRVVNKEVRATFIFEFLTWKYIWRFALFSFYFSLIVATPAILGNIFIGLPHLLYLTALNQLIVCYAIGVLFFALMVYLGVCCLFAVPIIIDRDMSAWSAMKLSYGVVKKRWFCVFGTLIWLFITFILGVLCLIVGLIWAIPYAQNVIALLYCDMFGIEGRDPVTLSEV